MNKWNYNAVFLWGFGTKNRRMRRREERSSRNTKRGRLININCNESGKRLQFDEGNTSHPSAPGTEDSSIKIEQARGIELYFWNLSPRWENPNTWRADRLHNMQPPSILPASNLAPVRLSYDSYHLMRVL